MSEKRDIPITNDNALVVVASEMRAIRKTLGEIRDVLSNTLQNTDANGVVCSVADHIEAISAADWMRDR